MNLNMYVTTWHLSRGWEPVRTRDSAHPSVVPFQNFATADGWVVVACPKQRFFALLARELDLAWMVDDPRFATMAARLEHREECIATIAERLLAETTATWVERLQAVGIPCGPILSIAEAVRDPQSVARDLVVETEHPTLGSVRQIRSPLRMPGVLEEVARAPFRGEHTREVLVEQCGYRDADVDRLRDDGVFGDVEV